MVKTPSINLDKIFSALITPMDNDQNINYNALKEIVELQLGDGVEGFYCCGSSGEGLLLSIDERKKVLETVIDQVKGRAPVVAHVGTIRTADAIELARHAKTAGADAVSMIPPYYYRFTMDEIQSYYEDILGSVPGFPGIIYNIPQFTGIDFDKDNAKRLFENPNIIGIKHTSLNLYDMERINDSYPDKLIFNGFDEQFLGALSMGAKATIGTTVNLFAPLFLKVRSCFENNKMEEAREAQRQINYIVEVMVSVGIFNAVKYGWTIRGIHSGSCRSPFKPLTDQDKTTIKSLMDKFATV